MNITRSANDCILRTTNNSVMMSRSHQVIVFHTRMKRNLDYTNPNEAVNFRDVGEYINLISGKTILPAGTVFRGGTIKAIVNPSVIGNPKTIFCLQKSPDNPLPGIHDLHFPISNDYEKYDTSIPEVRTWLKAIVRTIESGIEFPLYIHCLSGRDRTGVVVAALLKICGADDEDIIEEYNLSLGTENRNHLHVTLEGFRILDKHFNGIDLAKIKAVLSNAAS